MMVFYVPDTILVEAPTRRRHGVEARFSACFVSERPGRYSQVFHVTDLITKNGYPREDIFRGGLGAAKVRPAAGNWDGQMSCTNDSNPSTN
jgi:hypothetical protein